MILFILLLMFYITDAYVLNDMEYRCARFGWECNPFFYLPCCDFSNQCKRMGWGAMKYTYKCIKSSKLNDKCNCNLDCLNVDYTECVNGTCKCLPNYVEVNSFTCAALLKQFCKKNEFCIAPNSVCFDRKCQCKSSFVPKTDRECIPTPLGKNCKHDFDCKDTENTKCSDRFKCICKDNYVIRNNSTCQPLLGEFCKEDNDCAVDKSTCKNSECQCTNEFISKSNDKCIPSPLGKFCQNDDDCSEILHTKCSKTKTCVCRDNYDTVNKSICIPPLGKFCWKNEKCAATNSICYNNECKCKSGYVPKSKNECIKSPVGSTCRYDDDCVKILKQTKCSLNKKCICKENVVSKDGVSCLQILDDYCYNDNQCGPKYSICINYKCKCQRSFKAESAFECMLY